MKFGIYDIKNFINLTNPKRSLNVSLLFSKYDTTFDVIYPGKNASVVFGINNEYIVEKITLLTVLIPPTIRNDKNSLDKNIFNFDGLYSFHSISSFPLIIIALSASSASGVSESESALKYYIIYWYVNSVLLS